MGTPEETGLHLSIIPGGQRSCCAAGRAGERETRMSGCTPAQADGRAAPSPARVKRRGVWCHGARWLRVCGHRRAGGAECPGMDPGKPSNLLPGETLALPGLRASLGFSFPSEAK